MIIELSSVTVTTLIRALREPLKGPNVEVGGYVHLFNFVEVRSIRSVYMIVRGVWRDVIGEGVLAYQARCDKH